MKTSRPDFIINDRGEQFNASDYGYPFFFYDGDYYQSDKHQGHNAFYHDLADKMGWPHDDVSRKTVNNRKCQTTGRIFPKIEGFGGKTVVTIWRPLDKSPATIEQITEGVRRHFSVSKKDLLFHAGKNDFLCYDQYIQLLNNDI